MHTSGIRGVRNRATAAEDSDTKTKWAKSQKNDALTAIGKRRNPRLCLRASPRYLTAGMPFESISESSGMQKSSQGGGS